MPRVSGKIAVPASKSHTIRALLVASFADGESRLRHPLISRDSISCRKAVEALGAEIVDDDEDWIVRGFGSRPQPVQTAIDVGNSGTTLYFATAMAALSGAAIRFDGDEQLRRRSAAPLLDALRALGARIDSAPDGCAPYTVAGPIKAGEIEIDCPVSQYLSALLLATPLISSDMSEVTKITVKSLNEAPYVGITLDWLDEGGIQYSRRAWKEFQIPAGQAYTAIDRVVPADWSSATFFLVAAAITGGELVLEGLDKQDSQGDKGVADMLTAMGCSIEGVSNGIRIRGNPLKGVTLDLNATPDALPGMAVAACFAEGETRLINVPQARMKETDRIAVMTSELLKLGADVEELEDGMVIRGRQPGMDNEDLPVLTGALVHGHEDHRVVMALAVAALGSRGTTSIQGAEAVDVTYPGFFNALEEVSL